MSISSNNVPRPLTKEECELLAQFAQFEISLEKLLANFEGMLELQFGSEERKLTSHFLVSEPGIRIEIGHVRRALEKYSMGEIDDDDLFRWAIMLLLNDAYVWEGPDEEEIADILNELAIPRPNLKDWIKKHLRP